MSKKIFTGLFVVILISAFAGIAAAEGETAGDSAAGMGVKFGRGLWNVVSSPAEIPCTMRDDIKRDGGMGTVTGFGKGIAFFVRRAVVGVCEVGTFMIPMEATLPPVCAAPGTPAVS